MTIFVFAICIVKQSLLRFRFNEITSFHVLNIIKIENFNQLCAHNFFNFFPYHCCRKSISEVAFRSSFCSCYLLLEKDFHFTFSKEKNTKSVRAKGSFLLLMRSVRWSLQNLFSLWNAGLYLNYLLKNSSKK